MSSVFGCSSVLEKIADCEEGKEIGQGRGVRFAARDKATVDRVTFRKFSEITHSRDQRHFIREIIFLLRSYDLGVIKLMGFHFPEVSDPGKRLILVITEFMTNGIMKEAANAWFTARPPAGFGSTELSKVIVNAALMMDEVHAHNVIRLDLRPGIVLLDENRDPRMNGFWATRVPVNVSRAKMRTGTECSGIHGTGALQ
jgi:hypothetical protein